MAYDEELAERARRILSHYEGLMEKRMFGAISFMLNGKMCCGVIEDDLVVRVGPERYEETLGEPHVRPMDFTGRPTRGFVYVDREGTRTTEAIEGWVKLAMDFVESLQGEPLWITC